MCGWLGTAGSSCVCVQWTEVVRDGCGRWQASASSDGAEPDAWRDCLR